MTTRRTIIPIGNGNRVPAERGKQILRRAQAAQKAQTHYR